MSAFVLPVRSDLASYSFEVELDGKTYELGFAWNERAAGWFMSIRIPGEDELAVAGVRVVVGFPLAFRSGRSDLPPGLFNAIDTSGSGLEPGEFELGGRVVLLYLDEEELAEAAG